MPEAKFILVSLESKSAVRTSEFEAVLNKALDWVQIKEDTWLLWTTSDTQKWYSRLKPKLKNKDRVFICRVDLSERAGWMQKEFWAFIRAKLNNT